MAWGTPNVMTLAVTNHASPADFTLTPSPANGDLIVFATHIWKSATSCSVSSAADNQSSQLNFSRRVNIKKNNDGGADAELDMFDGIVPAAPSGSYIVNCTLSVTGCDLTFEAMWVSGADASPLDSTVTKTAYGLNANSFPVATNAVPAVDGELLFAAHCIDDSPASMTKDATFTIVGNDVSVNALLTQYIIQTTKASDTAGCTATGSYGWMAGILGYQVSAGVATLNQKYYRFRKDDGDQANATWDGDENATLTAPKGTRRIRFGIKATNDPTAAQYQLEWQKVSEGTWRKVR